MPALLLVGLTLAGCSAAPPAPAVAKPEAERTVEDPVEGSGQRANEPPAVSCTGLDELACLDSADCTLRQDDDKSYACTVAADDCERGFLQSAGRREDCAEGCSYSPAHCYCSPDVQCVCGGGPPAMCQAAG